MATIHAPTSPVARCRLCGVSNQFHSDTGIVGAHVRDHEFAAETVADFEPFDLTPPQLVVEIFAHPNESRAVACGDELRLRLAKEFGVSWDDLQEALT